MANKSDLVRFNTHHKSVGRVGRVRRVGRWGDGEMGRWARFL
ncbi:hypothetical protein BJP36_40740 [Moorena producens JHB]|uniref:Uncharacterized protein n=1 Tax=Moorena producens (strain JHB) TaxID=1454205 RepID=A0A9Q9SSA9_MOOP1|nr:hypothetical protein [Moorena producens]WAN68696.1 hypothetical protein BJP36_40740 [Moorena producens JHB]